MMPRLAKTVLQGFTRRQLELRKSRGAMRVLQGAIQQSME